MKHFLIIILILVVPFLIFVHFRGFIHHDEGWFLQAAYRMYNGDAAYKDFQFAYNPGGLFTNLLSFIIFGASILSSRIIAFANSLVSVFLLFYIGKKTDLSKAATLALILTYIFWAPGHINFVWPVIFCLTFALATILAYLTLPETKNHVLVFFITGVLSALTFIFKQNFGLAILLANAIFIIFLPHPEKFKKIFFHFLGYVVTLIPVIIYLIYNRATADFVSGFYYWTVLKIGSEGMLNSPFPWEYPGNFLYKIIKTLVYLFPLLISVFTIAKTKKGFFLAVICLLYYILSIRPTTDYIHLAPLLGLSALPLFLNKSKIIMIAAGSVLIIAGFYTAIFSNYYRWEPPLIKQDVLSFNPRANILVDNNSAEKINEITSYFQNNAKGEKYVFVYNFSPMFYFLLDKKNPTRFDYTGVGILSPALETESINALKEKGVKHIITISNSAFDSSEVTKFIHSNYSPVQTAGEFTIWAIR